MKIHAIRKNGETADALIKRFRKAYLQSGTSKLVQKKRYFRKDLNLRKEKITALKREFYRSKARKQKLYA